MLEKLPTLDHLTFRALYFSRIALELSFRALNIWREGTTCEIEKTTPVYGCIHLHTNL